MDMNPAIDTTLHGVRLRTWAPVIAARLADMVADIDYDDRQMLELSLTRLLINAPSEIPLYVGTGFMEEAYFADMEDELGPGFYLIEALESLNANRDASEEYARAFQELAQTAPAALLPADRSRFVPPDDPEHALYEVAVVQAFYRDRVEPTLAALETTRITLAAAA